MGSYGQRYRDSQRILVHLLSDKGGSLLRPAESPCQQRRNWLSCVTRTRGYPCRTRGTAHKSPSAIGDIERYFPHPSRVRLVCATRRAGSGILD